jgi:hypothetical protein
MYRRKKGTSKKIYVAVVLLVALLVASGALIYAALTTPKPVVPGVHVGDTFTYSLHGTSVLYSLDAVEPEGFSQYNQTDYFKVIITGVNGSVVSLDTEWRFTNGTSITGDQTIDLANGQQTDDNGFWAIYASNLQKNDLIRPRGYDGLIVNSTDYETYVNSTRVRDLSSIENSFFDTTDPTQSTWRNDIVNIYFDQQTGMLETLTNVQQYNNPTMALAITWKLVASSVWQV